MSARKYASAVPTPIGLAVAAGLLFFVISLVSGASLALALALAGGVIGVALGVAAAGRLAAQFGWPTLIRPEIVAIAVGFSAAVGIGFGLYPAHKASRLDPIQALRYE